MKYILFGVLKMSVELGIYVLLCQGFQVQQEWLLRSLVLYVVVMNIYGRYQMNTNLVWEEIRRIGKGLLLYFLAIMVCLPFTTSYQERLVFLVLSMLMLVVDIVVCRQMQSILFRKWIAKRTLVIGTGEEALRYVSVVHKNRFALTIIEGMVSLNQYAQQDQVKIGHKWVHVYNYASLARIIEEKKITQIVIITPEGEREQLDQIMTDLYNKVSEIKYMPEINSTITFASQVQDFDGMLLISTAKDRINMLDRIVKRSIDILAGVVGCMLVLPLTAYVKYQYVKSGDRNPIFFRQKRIGLNGKSIEIYKFRTMVPDAESVLEELMVQDDKIREEYLTTKKLQHDPRVTPVGERLRYKSLDEFPQFLNVIKGDMSLVGPRPYLWREKADMGMYYDSVIACKPGITGMWQAHGRSDVDFRERCKLDDYYYKNWSVWLDVVITYKTIKCVLYGEGAI